MSATVPNSDPAEVQPTLATGHEPMNYTAELNEPASTTPHNSNENTALANGMSESASQVPQRSDPVMSEHKNCPMGANGKADPTMPSSENLDKAPGQLENGPQGSQSMQPFALRFWDPRLKKLRMIYMKAVIIMSFVVMVLIWGVMAIYWGSLWKENDLSHNLHVMVVNYDEGLIGQTLVEALEKSNDADLPHPTYVVVDPKDYPTPEAIRTAIEPNYEYWGGVEIMKDATDRLNAARANGDDSWNPSAVVTLITNTARNFNVIPSVVLKPTQQFLMRAIADLNVQLTREFLSSTAHDADAINAALRAPQTVSGPVALGMDELRPWDHSVAIAPTFVGLIYLVILTLQLTMASFGARQPIQKFLRLRSLIAMRLVTPIVAYIPISLMVSLLNIPFQLPFGRAFPYGGGFMTWWCVTYVGMLVIGLCLESVMTLGGPKFIGIFMILFIISNVSVSNFPIEVSPSFFKYGYAMPFYQLRAIYITILFNSGKRTYGAPLTPDVLILKYIGILWAWLALIFLTFPVFIWYDHRKRHHAHMKEVWAVAEGPEDKRELKEAS